MKTLENLNCSLRKVYEAVWEGKKESWQYSEINYNKATERKSEIHDKVNLFYMFPGFHGWCCPNGGCMLFRNVGIYCFFPAKKAGKCQKYATFLHGFHKMLTKLSDFHYRMMGLKDSAQEQTKK